VISVPLFSVFKYKYTKHHIQKAGCHIVQYQGQRVGRAWMGRCIKPDGLSMLIPPRLMRE
jgi:hypothetical protein